MMTIEQAAAKIKLTKEEILETIEKYSIPMEKLINGNYRFTSHTANRVARAFFTGKYTPRKFRIRMKKREFIEIKNEQAKHAREAYQASMDAEELKRIRQARMAYARSCRKQATA